jgi:hypothetical protein
MRIIHSFSALASTWTEAADAGAGAGECKDWDATKSIAESAHKERTAARNGLNFMIFQVPFSPKP